MVLSVNSCCCGCTTRTGCMIIGIINVIIGILIFTAMNVSMIMSMMSVSEYNYQYAHTSHSIIYDIIIWVTFSYRIIFGLLKIVTGSILIMGVKQRNVKLVRICLFLGCMTMVATISSGALIASSIGGIIEMYFLLVVYSEYKEMLKSVNGGRVDQTMEPMTTY